MTTKRQKVACSCGGESIACCIMCDKHYCTNCESLGKECSNCKKFLCHTCGRICQACGDIICDNCGIPCPITYTYCHSCALRCNICTSLHCGCKFQECGYCGKPVCTGKCSTKHFNTHCYITNILLALNNCSPTVLHSFHRAFYIIIESECYDWIHAH